MSAACPGVAPDFRRRQSDQTTVEFMLARDPSEAVRSSLILPFASAYFDIGSAVPMAAPCYRCILSWDTMRWRNRRQDTTVMRSCEVEAILVEKASSLVTLCCVVGRNEKALALLEDGLHLNEPFSKKWLRVPACDSRCGPRWSPWRSSFSWCGPDWSGGGIGAMNRIAARQPICRVSAKRERDQGIFRIADWLQAYKRTFEKPPTVAEPILNLPFPPRGTSER